MSTTDPVYVTRGHPTKKGAGYDCNCGECLSRRICTCTNWCSDDKSLITCPHCLTLDICDPCPVVGFGCGLGCGDDDHCTPEQQKAADSAGAD